jgi:hypothetical protein
MNGIVPHHAAGQGVSNMEPRAKGLEKEWYDETEFRAFLRISE